MGIPLSISSLSLSVDEEHITQSKSLELDSLESMTLKARP